MRRRLHQREQPYERSLRRANNIRIRLGGDPGVLSPFPEKPKGMHWRTYERLSNRVWRAEGAAEEHLALVGRVNPVRQPLVVRVRTSAHLRPI